jgi:SAM-dependent methyltransferase
VFESILRHPALYILSQRAVGADRLRADCIDLLGPRAAVLDVGCGPAYYLPRMPAVEYYGFDTEPRYIEYAQMRWGSRARFHCETYSERHLATLPKFDGVLLMGLLHHLDDCEADSLLELVGKALTATGKVVTLDTCFDPKQPKFAAFLARLDRGQFVRQSQAFLELAGKRFRHVEGQLVGGDFRSPSSQFRMLLTQPVA